MYFQGTYIGGRFIFSDPSTQTVLFSFIVLEHYVNMYIAGLWRDSVLMGLNRERAKRAI